MFIVSVFNPESTTHLLEVVCLSTSQSQLHTNMMYLLVPLYKWTCRFIWTLISKCDTLRRNENHLFAFFRAYLCFLFHFLNLSCTIFFHTINYPSFYPLCSAGDKLHRPSEVYCPSLWSIHTYNIHECSMDEMGSKQDMSTYSTLAVPYRFHILV